MTAGPENKVAPRPVKAGEWYGKDWVILGGLNAGDKVIVDNLIKLRPGAPVEPKMPAAPATPPNAGGQQQGMSGMSGMSGMAGMSGMTATTPRHL
jgi:membrane fusion protein (multidrug efflux system)